MEKIKTVSVIMGTYNGEKYIREQLDSILSQTYPIKEIIIQDDGSTDGTVRICEEYAERYSNILFSRNKSNLGFNLNFKSAALRATGDYVAISDQDDVWFPQKIAKQVEAIGDYDLCFSTHLRGADMQHTHLVSPQYSLEALLFCGFAGHTMLLRKEFIQTSEYWIDKIGYDWSLAICAQLHRGIAFVDEPLNWHRTNTESVCHVEMKRNGRHVTQHPTYQPYLYGLRNFRRLQKKSNWQKLYSYIYVHTEDRRFELVHSMAHCMLSRNLGKLLQLCYLCMKHSDSVYYRKSQKGFMGKVRAFCYPFIFSYNNVQYDRK